MSSKKEEKKDNKPGADPEANPGENTKHPDDQEEEEKTGCQKCWIGFNECVFAFFRVIR